LDMTKVLTVSEFARMGGRARAKKLTPERRREIAKKASDAAKAALDKRRRTTPNR
jgi:hypothetical protein